MRKYDTIHEVEHPEQIIKQYHYTTALDAFIITITKEAIDYIQHLEKEIAEGTTDC